MRVPPFPSVLLCWLFVVAALAADLPPLTTIAEVLAEPHAMPPRKQPVKLKAVVLYFKPGLRPDVFVCDSSSSKALFVNIRACPAALERGDEVEIEGDLASDGFATSIAARTVYVTGKSTLPSPKPVPLASIRTLKNGQYVTLSGYVSADGSNWSLVSSLTTSMASQVNIGLAVTAHNNGALCTSVFDNVQMTALP